MHAGGLRAIAIVNESQNQISHEAPEEGELLPGPVWMDGCADACHIKPPSASVGHGI